MKIRPSAALAYSMIAAATALLANQASAQSANAGNSAYQARSAAMSDQIEVVRVTAQKRQEDSNKVAGRRGQPRLLPDAVGHRIRSTPMTPDKVMREEAAWNLSPS